MRRAIVLAAVVLTASQGVVTCARVGAGSTGPDAMGSLPSSSGQTRAGSSQERGRVTGGVLRPDTAPAQPAPQLTPEERERLLQELRRKQIQNAPSSDPGRPGQSVR